MNAHNPELISALIDGELKGVRRWLIRRHVTRCALCAAEYRRLERVRQLTAPQPRMTDSPEFFWSKVKRDIQSQAGQTETIPTPQLSLADWLSQRRYALASVTLVVALAAFMLFRRPEPHVVINTVATTIPNTTATTIAEQDSDTPVIWVTGLPWTKDMTEMKTVFANLDT